MRQSIMTEIHLQHHTGSDLHGQGANQQDSAAQSNATKHYNRDEFEK